MKQTWTAAALIAFLLPIAAGAKDPKSGEPFYRRFLAPGNPIDDRILEYEKKIAAHPDSATTARSSHSRTRSRSAEMRIRR